jgi:cyclic-di-GMP phosphodiesterase TipF (flagellum assembly factor)
MMSVVLVMAAGRYRSDVAYSDQKQDPTLWATTGPGVLQIAPPETLRRSYGSWTLGVIGRIMPRGEGASMSRLGAIFIVVCMVVIAASTGAALYLLAGLHAAESMTVAVAVLTGLAIYGAVTSRSRDRFDVGSQIADLSRGTADLAHQVAEMGRRTAALETQGDRIASIAIEKTRAANEAVTAEIAELGTLVKQLAEAVALHELKFAGKDFDVLAPGDDGQVAPVAPPARPVAPITRPPVIDPQLIETVTEAVGAGRIDLYLQPIVTLPQRKVRYYEAFTRLRTADGAQLTPTQFLPAAEAAGLMSRVDKLLLFRSAQVVRRLQLKNREVGLFCNISASTLNDTRLFPEILQFMDANRALAPALILEMRQSTLHAAGPLEAENLAALRDLGFCFCVDAVTDLRLEPRDLGQRGIRHVKVAASLLLSEAATAGSDIHAADLSDLLARFGVGLIAERVENESQVVDLLEYDVRFGQGYLFSQPRPVRADALLGTAYADEPKAPEASRKVTSAGSSAPL